MAGGIGDLARRASVYHHLYAHSGGNHCFPLLAAHGALWASGYFRRGMRFGAMLAAMQGLAGADRVALSAGLQRFADSFRDINRQVCVETFFVYRLTARPSLRDEAERLVAPELIAATERCHHARVSGRAMNSAEKRALFEAFFRWEQAAIVGPAVTAAFDAFEWPSIKRMALRPAIGFAYFKGGPLRFHDFADADERIVMGLRAYDYAASAGWDRVKRTLADYRLMPRTWEADPAAFFAALNGPAIAAA